MTTHKDADNVPSDEDRARAYAEAIEAKLDAIHYAPRQGCDCAACTDDISAGDLAWHIRNAVMAVADREQAALHYERDVACNSINQQRVAETALLQSRLDDALGAITRVQALHAKWERDFLLGDDSSRWRVLAADELNAALRGPEPAELQET